MEAIILLKIAIKRIKTIFNKNNFSNQRNENHK